MLSANLLQLRSVCSSGLAFQGSVKRAGPLSKLDHGLLSCKPLIQEAPHGCRGSLICAAAVREERAKKSKGVRARFSKDIRSVKTLPDLAVYLGEGSNAQAVSDRQFCRLGLIQALHLVSERNKTAPQQPRLSGQDKSAILLVVGLVQERLPKAFASCSKAVEVSQLLKSYADVAWISNEPFTAGARLALSDVLQSKELLEDLFVSSASSIALCPFLECYAAASQAGLRPGPLPYSILVHTLEQVCKLPSEDERVSISRAVKAVYDVEQGSSPAPSASQARQQQQQQQQPQLHEEGAGGEASSRGMASARDDPDIAMLRSIPLTTLPNVLRVLKDAKQAVKSEGGSMPKAVRLQALATVVAAALREGDWLVDGQTDEASPPAAGGPDVKGERPQRTMLRFAADLLPYVTAAMGDEDLCKVVRVLSYWCKGRGSAGLSSGAFLQLFRPRLCSPQFLHAAAAQGVLPEVIVFSSGCGESSSTVSPLLKFTAKQSSSLPEPKHLKAAAAIVVAGWDDESSAEIIEACFAKFGHDTVRSDSRLAQFAWFLKDESGTEMCRRMFSGLAAAAAKQPHVDIKLGIAQFVGQMIEVEEASNYSFGDTVPWGSLSGASPSLMRILRGVEASLGQPSIPEYMVKSHQWVTIARLGAAASTYQASMLDASRIVFKASNHLRAGNGLEKLDALELADLARSLLRVRSGSNGSNSNSHQEAILSQVISAVNPKLELLSGDELAECAKRQVLPGESLQKHAESFLCSTLREACAKLRDGSMGAKGLATLLEAVARLPLAERDSGIFDPELVPDACEQLARISSSSKPLAFQLEPQQLDRLCRSVVSLSYYDADLLDALCQYARKNMAAFPQTSLSSVMYACAHFNHRKESAEPLFDAWAKVHGPSIPRLRLGELGKLSWSFAVMDLNPCFGKKAEGGESSGSESDAEEQGFEEPATKHNRKALKQQLSVVDELLRCTSQSKTKQLQQSSKVVRGQLSYAVRIWAAAGHAHKKPLQELQGSLTKCVVQDGRTSELEKEVRKELAKDPVLKLQSIDSQVDVGHGWIVDIMVETASGNELVVEVDGPQHYATCRHRAGTGVHPLGNTTIRDISLRRLGKRVVCLAAKDLDFHTNKKKTIKLLREKVQAADG